MFHDFACWICSLFPEMPVNLFIIQICKRFNNLDEIFTEYGSSVDCVFLNKGVCVDLENYWEERHYIKLAVTTTTMSDTESPPGLLCCEFEEWDFFIYSHEMDLESTISCKFSVNFWFIFSCECRLDPSLQPSFIGNSNVVDKM